MNPTLELKKEIKPITGIKTDAISINYTQNGKRIHPHTILLFIPGNPGCIGWYAKPFLYNIIQKLGTGYAAHGISYAGHGVGDEFHVETPEEMHPFINNKQRILHTIQGQVDHKIHWIDSLLHQYKNVNIIFLTHSIGSYLVQTLCVQRHDILSHTVKIIHLMPFYRFKPSNYIKEQLPLEIVAKLNIKSVQLLAFISYFLSYLPKNVIMHGIDTILNIKDIDDQEITWNIVKQPNFIRNFLSLGIHEILNVPKEFDVDALNVIAKQCPTIILYCDNDKWAPKDHVYDIMRLQHSNKVLNNSVYFEHMEDVQHDFVVYSKMVERVEVFVLGCVRGGYDDRFHYDLRDGGFIPSKL